MIFKYIGCACIEKTCFGMYRLYDHNEGTFKLFDTWKGVKEYVKQNKLDK